MVGLQRSRQRRTSTTRQILLALLALLALVASACGSGDATDGADVSAADDAVAETAVEEETSAPAEDVPAADDNTVTTDDSESPSEPTDEDDAVVDAVEAAADEAVEEAVAEANAAAEANDDGPVAQVLALVADNSSAQSYSFTQGMAMRMNIAGEALDIAPDEPYVFGEVENGVAHTETNIGVIMTATFDSLGIDVSEPPFDEMFAAIGDASIETWSDDETLVVDMSSFAAAIGDLDPATAAETAAFADGPVRIDLTQVDGLDAASIANEFGQGAQVTDPAEILQALRNVSSVSETGTDKVNGVDVRVFTGTLSMADYSAALGVDLADQLNATNLGEFETESEAEMAAAMLPALEELQVGLVVMVDGDDLVRRMELSIDMGAMLQAMFESPDVVAAMAAEEGVSVEEIESQMEFLGPGLEMTIDTWQEFDNYGDSFGIEFPAAVDITDRLDEFDLAS